MSNKKFTLESRLFTERFARRLQRKMEYLELSQTDLAKRAGLTQSEISQLVNAHTIPRADTVVKLARALNMSTDDLIMFDT
jgi:transcriptional regulator with XRE-family HTH domain